MPIWVTLQGIFSTTIVLGIIAVLVRDVLLQRQHSRFLDELQWNRTVQERAATVAAYLALATRLRADSPPEDFERAERMSFELAMWLPAEIYRETRDAIMKPGDPEVNFGTAVIAVRKLLLKDKSADDSIVEACLLRFRPILMTTLAALLGALPLAFGTGVGSELRRPLGITIIGGLIASQLLTLYTTPVVYLYFDRAQRWLDRVRSR